MSASVASSSFAFVAATTAAIAGTNRSWKGCLSKSAFTSKPGSFFPSSHHHHPFLLRVRRKDKKTYFLELPKSTQKRARSDQKLRRQNHALTTSVTNDSSRTEVSTAPATEISEADEIVDGMDFGELCNEFECKSSPLVESTARQLARDILELREGSRALGTFAVSVKYKDPLRSFTGREKYKRPLWVTSALDKPSVSVQEMVMLSTSVLSIKWIVKGKPKSSLAVIGGELVIKINSQFTLNQISGQVIEHEEFWDLSSLSIIAQAFFWTSRRAYATVEGAKDLADLVKDLSSRFSREKENMEIYPDPTGDPTKFFQRDDSFQRDAYQIALLLAVLYFVIQFLRATL